MILFLIAFAVRTMTASNPTSSPMRSANTSNKMAQKAGESGANT